MAQLPFSEDMLTESPMLDINKSVIHLDCVTTNVRTFLRNFASFKTKARRGEAVRIKDGDGEYLFTAVAGRKSLLGAAKGKIAIHGDITGPTLKNDAWKPSV